MSQPERFNIPLPVVARRRFYVYPKIMYERCPLVWEVTCPRLLLSVPQYSLNTPNAIAQVEMHAAGESRIDKHSIFAFRNCVAQK